MHCPGNRTNVHFIFALTTFVLLSGQVFSTTYYSKQSGNWNGAWDTWSTTSCGGTGVGMDYPDGATDVAYICAGHTITLTSTAVSVGTVHVDGASAVLQQAQNWNSNLTATNFYVDNGGSYIDNGTGQHSSIFTNVYIGTNTTAGTSTFQFDNNYPAGAVNVTISGELIIGNASGDGTAVFDYTPDPGAATTYSINDDVTVFSNGSYNCAPTGSNAPACPALTLPVELTNFDAVCQDQAIALHWETATETNNNFFTIEHSLNGASFVEIGTIPGAGNSSTPLAYTFTHAEAFHGVHYYRLKQTDYDGTQEYVGLTSSNGDCAGKAGLKILDAKMGEGGALQLRMAADKFEEYHLKIMSLSGQLIYQTSGTTNDLVTKLEVNPRNYATSGYFIVVQSGAQIDAQKVVLVN